MKYPFKKFHKKINIKQVAKKSFGWLCRPARLKGEVLKFRVKIKGIRKKAKK